MKFRRVVAALAGLLFALAPTTGNAESYEARQAHAVALAAQHSKDCGHVLLDAEDETSRMWSECMAGALVGMEPDSVRPTTSFRIRNEARDLYLTGRSYGLMLWLGSIEDNKKRDLWILEPFVQNPPPGSVADRAYWRDGKTAPNLFLIINVKTGLALGSNKWLPIGFDDFMDTNAYLAPKGVLPAANLLWDLETADGADVENAGNGLFDDARTQLFNWSTQESLVGRQVQANPTWVLEEAEQVDLARVEFQSVKAIRTSTGQDKNTRAMFDGIQAVAEYGPGLATGGASLASSASHIAAAIAKKLAAKAARKIAQKVAIKAAERAATRAAAQVVGGLARHQAKMAAITAAKQTSKQLGQIVARQTAKQAAKKSVWLTTKTAYSRFAKFAGVKGTRALTAKMVSLADKAATMAVINKRLEDSVAAHDAATIDGSDRTLVGEALPEGFMEPVDFADIIRQLDDAPGRQDDEGWLESLFSPLIDETDDDLYMYMNGQQIWPDTSGHRAIANGASKPVGVNLIFDRLSGLKFDLKEYDYGSGDDHLGTLQMETQTLIGPEEYEDAYAYNVSEGSLYGLTFTLEPYFVPTDAQVVSIREAAWLMDATREASWDLRTQEALTDRPARQKAERDRLEQATRDQILATDGPDALAKYDSLKLWQVQYLANCDAHDDLNSDARAQVGRSLIPGTWRVGRFNARGEKDRTHTTDFELTRDNWYQEQGNVVQGQTGTAALWSATRFIAFDSETMNMIGPKLGVPRDAYCAGVFMKNPATDLPSEIKSGLAGTDLSGTANAVQNFVPMFTVDLAQPYAFVLNAGGEPVAWMQKIANAPELPTNLCHINGEPSGWQNDHDIEKIMPGTWQAEQIACPGVGVTDAPRAAIPPRWTFTTDGILLAQEGDGAHLSTQAMPWQVRGGDNGNCIVNLGEQGQQTSVTAITIDRADGEIWSFKDDGKTVGYQHSSVPRRQQYYRKGSSCFRVSKIDSAVQYGQMALAARETLDEYRTAKSLPRPQAERADAAAVELAQDAFLQSLGPEQKHDRCAAVGYLYTRLPAAANDGSNEIHVRNDSDEVWSVYWMDNQGNDRVAYPSDAAIEPVAIVQPGEQQTIKSADRFSYAIYSAGEKYGPSQCVGVVTSRDNDRYDEQSIADRDGKTQHTQIRATLFTSSYEIEKVAKQAADEQKAREADWQRADEEARRQTELKQDEIRKQFNEEKRLADLATAAEEKARRQRIKDAKGCLDIGTASLRGDTEALARVVNDRSDAMRVRWINTAGQIDMARATVTVAPGQSQLLVDYVGAKYQAEDASGNCLAIVGTDFTTHTFEDSGSTSAKSALTYALPFAMRTTKARLIPEQIANGCELAGQTASRPTNPRWNWHVTIYNDGATDMNVSWVSFYGEDENGEQLRKPDLMATIPSGEQQTWNSLAVGDVLSVQENDGQCVAVARGPLFEDGGIKQRFNYSDYHLTDRATLVARQQEIDAAKAEEQRLSDIEAAKRRAESDALAKAQQEQAAAEQRAADAAEAERKAEQARVLEEDFRRRQAELEAQRLVDEANARQLADQKEALRQQEAEKARQEADAIEASRLADEAQAKQWAAEDAARAQAEADAAQKAAAEAERLRLIEQDRAAIMLGKANALTEAAQCRPNANLSREDVLGDWVVGPYDPYGDKGAFDAPGAAVWQFSNGQEVDGQTANGPFRSFFSTSDCAIAVSGRVPGFGFEFTANVSDNADGTREFFILDDRGELFMWGVQAARVRTAYERDVINEIGRLDGRRGTGQCDDLSRPFDSSLLGQWDAGRYDANGSRLAADGRWAFSEMTASVFRIDGQLGGSGFSANGEPSGCGYRLFLANRGAHILSFYQTLDGEDGFYIQREGQLDDSLVMWGLKNHDDEIRAAQEELDRQARDEEVRRVEQDRIDARMLADQIEADRLAAEQAQIELANQAERDKLAAADAERQLVDDERINNRQLDEAAQRKAQQNGCFDGVFPVSVAGNSEAQLDITNAGSADLTVYWINTSGALERLDDAQGQQVVIRPGQTQDIPTRRDYAYWVQDSTGQCVGVARVWESRNGYSYDAAEAAPGITHPVGLVPQTGGASAADTDAQPVADERANKDYSTVLPDDVSSCGAAFPAGPENDKGYYDCMDDGLARAQQAAALAAEPLADVRQGNDYSFVSEADTADCQGRFPAGPENDKGYYDCMDDGLARGQQAAALAAEPVVDVRQGNDYSFVSEADTADCQGRFPAGPENDKGYYDCMDDGLARAQQAVQPAPDVRQGNDYSSVSEADAGDCQGWFPAGPDNDEGFYDCMDDAVVRAQQPVEPAPDARQGNDYSSVSEADAADCQAWYPAGPANDQGFYDCMDQGLANARQAAERGSSDGMDAQQAQPANDNTGEQQLPGWDRGDVFYQPADDFCTSALGMDRSVPEYSICYFAYPDYQAGDTITNYCRSEYEYEEQRGQCVAALQACANTNPNLESAAFEQCAVNTGW
ncbi:MAG: hypothetical protein ACOH2N_07435 [Devosia sp.]